jgi:hypothetical protein
LSRGQIPNRLHYDIINKSYTLLAYDSDVDIAKTIYIDENALDSSWMARMRLLQ